MSTPDFQDLLVKTSRTFALSIPLLEPPTSHEVTIGYLLLRIADTFEDAAVWPRERRIEALREFSEMLSVDRGTLDDEGREREATRIRAWLDEPPTGHDGYLELLAETGAVLDALHRLEAPAREIVRRHTVRTADGMAAFVARADAGGVLRLHTVVDLRDYCYVVAGIVGEMLTELFLCDPRCPRDVAELLRRRAAQFGEALQLVNILRDAADDRAEGRTFVPAGVARAELFAIARSDLDTAGEYTAILEQAGAPRGTVAFTTLPVRLARETLTAVEREGPGAKVPRGEVVRIFQEIQASVSGG